MNSNIETIIKKVVKRAIDLYLNQNSILNIDNEPFDNEFFNTKLGIFVELADSEDTVIALGNISSELTVLDNIIFVLINTIKSLDEEYIEKLRNNELKIRVWFVDEYLNLKNKDEREKVYGVSINKPAIMINKNDVNTYCYLPSVWEEQSDAIYILENLAINAGLDKNAWKENEIDLITFKPNLIEIN